MPPERDAAPDAARAELNAPSWTAAALRHQLAFLKVAFLKDTKEKGKDELADM